MAHPKITLRSVTLACSLMGIGLSALWLTSPQRAQAADPNHLKWAATPPMGWNSWDSFATTVTEAQTRAQADYMAEKLAKFGWQYIVVDIQWYEPNATGFNYRPGAALTMDKWGRLLPAPNKFPSAANEAGFKALADAVHKKGLKFGVHLMRGIPRQAVAQNTPIMGTNFHASDIANTKDTCPWNSDMYGVDMSKPGAQEYYNSVFQMFADWGLDFIKVDDLSRPYHQPEIEGIRKAIDKTGRPIVFSTSPGETPLTAGNNVSQNANMWRMSDDFWDTWSALLEQFERTRKWAPYIGAGHFPDADMLPLGAIRSVQGYGGPNWTRFTPDEQKTMMSLWSIARSPLMMGGDMTKNDEYTLSLLTNAEVLGVNQHSLGNHQLWNQDGLIAWIADVPDSRDKYLALFNTRDQGGMADNLALYRSPLVTRNTPGHSVPISADITGAKKLVLVVDDGGDTFNSDHADWVEPRLTGPAGTMKLTDLKWSKASTGWGEVSTQVSAGGKPMMVDGKAVAYGIGAHARSVIEFDIPTGYTRFEARGGLDDTGTSQEGGSTVHFLVFTDKALTMDPGAKIPVALETLGFGGPVTVRDLWAKKDLGRIESDFAPVIPWHGSGLYRLSAAK